MTSRPILPTPLVAMDTTTSRIHPGVILGLACAAQFMVVLDIAIVNVALPSIQQDLDVGQSTLQWVVVAYGLLLGGFLLLGGRMADLLGRRRVLVVGMTIFSAASFVAGVAQSSAVLITARGLQGFGAALVAPAALSIVAVTFSEGPERNRALGIFGAIGGGAASVGVIASGLLTDGPGWRWVFFINIPVGIVLIGMAMAFLTADRAERGTRNFDVAGATTVTGGLMALVYGLNQGAEDGWTAITTLSLFAAAALLLASFVGIEARSRTPLVPAAAVKHRTLVAANLSAFFAFGAFFSFIFLGSLFMQQVLGYSPTKTGVAWLATSVTAFAGAAVAGARLVAVVGVRRLLVIGLSLLAIGMLWLALGAGRSELRHRSAPGVRARGRGARAVRPVGPDRGAVGRLGVDLGAGVGSGRDDARDRRRRRRRRRVDRACLSGRTGRVPGRVRRHLCRRRRRGRHRSRRLPAPDTTGG